MTTGILVIEDDAAILNGTLDASAF